MVGLDRSQSELFPGVRLPAGENWEKQSMGEGEGRLPLRGRDQWVGGTVKGWERTRPDLAGLTWGQVSSLTEAGMGSQPAG